jgi:hypothetical protein
LTQFYRSFLSRDVPLVPHKCPDVLLDQMSRQGPIALLCSYDLCPLQVRQVGVEHWIVFISSRQRAAAHRFNTSSNQHHARITMPCVSRAEAHRKNTGVEATAGLIDSSPSRCCIEQYICQLKRASYHPPVIPEETESTPVSTLNLPRYCPALRRSNLSACCKGESSSWRWAAGAGNALLPQ